MTQTMRATIRRADIDPSTKLDLVVDQLFNMFIANPALAAVFVNEQHQLIQDKRGNVAKHYDDFFDLGEDIIREGIRKKMFTADVDVKLFRYFIIGGIREVLRQWSQQAQTFPLDRVRQNVKHFLKQGLLPK